MRGNSTILVVEDSPEDFEATRRALEKPGLDAIQRLADFWFEVVVFPKTE